jgi:hypothetical protein
VAELVAAALSYAERRWAVFPLNGKLPRTAHGLKDASTDPEQIRDWWQRWPDAGIGIATGGGLLVLDVDPDHGGDDALAELERQHGELPETVRAETGGGGTHFYFSANGDLRNTAGRLGEGLDTRADGGYVVAPPSPHPSGRRYEWDVGPDEAEPPPPPQWLLELLSATPSTPSSNGADPIPEGRRNAELASLAGTMRRRGMPPTAILAALAETNRERCRPPLAEREVTAIAASVTRYEPEHKPDPRPPAAERLKVITAKRLLELPEPPRSDELLGTLLVRRQRTVLGGYTGEGKTTLGLQMVAAMAEAGDFLGCQGRGGRGLVIDAEQGLRTIRRRVSEAGLSESDVVDVLRVPDGLALDSDEEEAAALEAILEAGRYDAVLADPLYKLHRGESNEERHAVALMARLDAWRDHFGFALLLLSHPRKRPPQGARLTIDELFGSAAFNWGAEVVLGIERPRPGYARLHFFKDRDGDLPVGEKWGLLFDRESGFRRDPDDGKPRETTADRVRELLSATPGMTTGALVEAIGASERTVRGALRGLGATTPDGAGGVKRWWLPEDNPQEELM